MNRLNLLLALCALVLICCTSSCGGSGAGDLDTAAALTGATPALAIDGQDTDELVGKSVSSACKWKHVSRCWCQCPAQVKNVKATSNPDSISLAWNKVKNAHGYRINYRVEGAKKWSFAGFSNTNSFTFNCDLAGCTYYEFRVRALSCYCPGKWSTVVKSWIGGEPAAAVPGTVTGITLTGGDSTITANWTAVDGAESYTVQFRAAGTEEWTDAGLATEPTLELTGDFATCTKYEVRIRATNCKGDSDWSETATGWLGGTEPPDSAPGAVTLTSVGTGDDDTISVAWDALAGAESYEVSYRAQGDEQWTVAGISTTTGFDLTGNLVECTFYEVRARASNCKGDGEYSEAGVGYIGATSPDDCGADECAACSGGITELTVGYSGKKAADVVVTDAQGAQLFSGSVNQGDQFTVTAAQAGAALGKKITLNVGNKSWSIKTNCKQDVGPGFEVGKFAVLAGKSGAGDLCPITPCPVCGHNDCEYHCKACKCKAHGDDDGCDSAYDQCRAHNGGEDGSDDNS
jgi:fibronectin type 3 domain-containing protein